MEIEATIFDGSKIKLKDLERVMEKIESSPLEQRGIGWNGIRVRGRPQDIIDVSNLIRKEIIRES